MTAHKRRQAALDAIDAIVSGALAGDEETETVDFKEEAGTVVAGGARQPIGPQHEPAAVKLAAEAACMANSPSGGVIVVGVVDDRAGPSAITGSYLDTAWLRRRIHALTQPNLALDEIEEITPLGARIYLINVAPALEEVRCAGRLRARHGTDCVELSGDRAREFLEQRRGFDWSSEPSGLRFSSATVQALASARGHYRAEHGTAPGSDLEIARRMGVVIAGDDEQDPELTNAGALLLCGLDPGTEQLQALATPSEGVPSRHSVRGPAPLLALFDETWEMVTRDAFTAQPQRLGAQRTALRAVPERALREALINAVMHRDYRMPRSAVVALATGTPANTFKVRSPGGLPPGVSIDRLISTPSRPRNPSLAQALRVLGLAEQEGIGVDTMYALMLRDGHAPPEITEDAGDVVVVLRGGSPDLVLRAFFDDLDAAAGRGADEEDARIAIALTALLGQATLRPEGLAPLAQCTVDEALTTLSELEALDAVERLVNRSKSFRLTAETRARLGTRVQYRTHRAIDEHAEFIFAYLDTRPEIGRDAAAGLLGVSGVRASQVLGQLAREGRLRHVANSRGPRVRYAMPE